MGCGWAADGDAFVAAGGGIVSIRVLRALAGALLLAAAMVLPSASGDPAGAIGSTEFQPITPIRLLDTRIGNGAPAVKVGPGETITVQITGRGDIPASGVSAVSLNITATAPTAASYLTMWPTGQARPTASILNFAAGRTIANSTIVGLSPSGQIDIYNHSGETHVLADISGWFPTGSDFTPTTPARLLDTRIGNGAPAIKVGPGETVTVQITGRAGIPASGVAAVSVNITATAETTNGYLTAWPAGAARPTASILNFAASTSIANSTIVGVSASGQISIYNSAGDTHILADVSGWLPAASDFTAITPVRLLDTRIGNGAPSIAVGPGQTVDVQITGRGGVPTSGVSAVAVNLTATQATESAYLTAWPTGQSRPTASILNFPANRSTANATILGLSPTGQLSIFNNTGNTHVIADISGYFTSKPRVSAMVAAGIEHSCGLATNGTVKCWGTNWGGQLGNGTNVDTTTAVPVSGLSGVQQISTATDHTCAVTDGGAISCWGWNRYGQLGDGTTTNAAVPITVPGITNATQVSAGDEHTCALLTDTTVRCWGRNGASQLGEGTLNNSLVPVTVTGLSNVTQVSAGARHTCALLTNSTITCWGGDYFGQLGDTAGHGWSSVPVQVTGLVGATQVSAGHYHTCARLLDGSARCWGWNNTGQLGDGTTTDAETPVTPLDLTGVAFVAAGQNHSCALLASGEAACWGENGDGRLGNGANTSSTQPVRTVGLTDGSGIATGWSHTCVSLDSGGGKCWGHNVGKLGDGTQDSRSIPVSVIGF